MKKVVPRFFYLGFLFYIYTIIKNKNIILRNKGHSKPLENKYINDNCFQLVPIALSNNEIETSMDFYKMTNDCGTSSLYKPNNKNNPNNDNLMKNII